MSYNNQCPARLKDALKAGLLDRIVSHYILQMKYDGVCGVVSFKRTPDGFEHRIESRTGTQIVSCDHIPAQLEAFPGVREGVYFGEFWIPNTPQRTINGLVMRHAPSPEVHFVIFDYVSHAEYEAGFSARGWEERMCALPELFLSVDDSRAKVYCAHSEGTLELLGTTPETACADLGVDATQFDGLIARDPTAPWAPGKSGPHRFACVKLKPRERMTVRIVDFDLGQDGYTGMIGALVYENKAGIRGRVGTGLKMHERDPGEFDQRWRNKLVDIEYMHLQPSGLPREPVLVMERNDAEVD